MEVLTNVVNFFLGLGAPVFVPIIMIIAGICVGMKVSEAISSGITLGVAFAGMNLLITFMKDSITPAAQDIMLHTGISLPVIDGGWSTMATISWAWPYAFLMFPLLILVNVAMILLKKTNTINADLWNVWLKIFTAVAVVYITKSVLLAFVVAAVQIIVELKSADIHQHRIEKATGIPGVTVTHTTLLFGAVLYPFAWLLRKIPFLNKEFDAQALRDKFGIFAENHVMGFLLGCLFGVLARYGVAETLMLGVKAAASMTLFPVVAKYFMQALAPISEAISEFMNKKFAGRTLFVGLDWPILGGCNEIWIAILWSIPILLVFSMFLPGNMILPFAGLMSASLALPAFLVSRGNLLQMLILCVIGAPAFLWVGTAFAPVITDLAMATGSVALESGELISNSLINGPVFTYAISHIFLALKGNFLPLILAIYWALGFFFYSRELRQEAAADAAAAAGAEEGSDVTIQETVSEVSVDF